LSGRAERHSAGRATGPLDLGAVGYLPVTKSKKRLGPLPFRKAKEYNLPMEGCGGRRVNYDGSRLVLFLCIRRGTRVDFRDWSRDLAQSFKAHIELRQIGGGADEAKVNRRVSAAAGLTLCLPATWLTDFNPVSIKWPTTGSAFSPMEDLGRCAGRLLLLSLGPPMKNEAVYPGWPRQGLPQTGGGYRHWLHGRGQDCGQGQPSSKRPVQVRNSKSPGHRRCVVPGRGSPNPQSANRPADRRDYRLRGRVPE